MWELLGCELDILQINTCGCSTAKLLFYSLCHSVYVAKCECLLRRDYTFILDTCLSLSISLSPDGFGWLKSTTALECRFGVNGEWLWRAHTHTLVKMRTIYLSGLRHQFLNQHYSIIQNDFRCSVLGTLHVSSISTRFDSIRFGFALSNKVSVAKYPRWQMQFCCFWYYFLLLVCVIGVVVFLSQSHSIITDQPCIRRDTSATHTLYVAVSTAKWRIFWWFSFISFDRNLEP